MFPYLEPKLGTVVVWGIFCLFGYNFTFAQSDLEKAAKALQIFSDTLNKIQNPNQPNSQNPYNNQPQQAPQNQKSGGKPEGSTPELDWGTKVLPDNTVFPSIIFSLPSVAPGTPFFEFLNGKNPQNLIGDPASCIAVLTVPKQNLERITVRLTAEPFLRQSSISVNDLRAGSPKIIKPTLNWDFQALRRNPQSSPATLVTEFIDQQGRIVGQTQKRVMIRSANECPILPSPRPTPIDDFLIGFVNENSPLVDTVLQYGQDSTLSRSYSGYSDPSTFWNQLFSVWYSLQKRGIRYSNIAAVAPPGFGAMPAQHIRFMDESILRSQANCIDGTVLLASVYTRLGFKAGVVLLKIGDHPQMLPDHAILAVKAPQGDIAHALIDSTVMGNAQFAGKSFQTASWENFNNALYVAGQGMDKSRRAGYIPKIVYVDEARANGIRPIPILSAYGQ